jgi:peptidoglycan/LPS O-acetylase OafA/YrhL
MPLAEIVTYESNFTFSIYGIKNPADNTWLYHTLIISIVAALESIGALVTIFMYKNRKQQIKVSQFLLLLNTALIVSAFLLIDTAKSMLPMSGDILVKHKISMIFPLLSIILIFLAIKAIKKDEELVRSADRLR